ncbi:hypothetical protein J2X66_002402 [Pseudomonas sp. 3296]|uniref:hypothetical protein n=1 Tax=Pseudomonas sp. 3296 TaxID=2817753 RepID=UPI00285857F3|nr:hypothetical protein [Pseudomonas sp. 3296]MDR6915534.1 hypothetical protein [Pseudomonas sp. 3296]
MTNKTAPIEIAIHSPTKGIVDLSNNEFSQQCMKDLGLCWYKIDKSANDKNLPDVLVKNGSNSLSLSQLTNITIVTDERVSDKVENLNITLRGLPDNSSHEQNKIFIYELIENIKSSGWKHYYFVEDPRIPGSQAEKIDSPDHVLGHYVSSHPWLDPNYKIDIDRWLKIGSFYNWFFYNDGVYLHLKAWRHDSKDTPTKTGTYLISLEFQSEREYWKSSIPENERNRWEELLPEKLSNLHETRSTIEKKARAVGIEIDESYQDPLIQALNN